MPAIARRARPRVRSLSATCGSTRLACLAGANPNTIVVTAEIANVKKSDVVSRPIGPAMPAVSALPLIATRPASPNTRSRVRRRRRTPRARNFRSRADGSSATGWRQAPPATRTRRGGRCREPSAGRRDSHTRLRAPWQQPPSTTATPARASRTSESCRLQTLNVRRREASIAAGGRWALCAARMRRRAVVASSAWRGLEACGHLPQRAQREAAEAFECARAGGGGIGGIDRQRRERVRLVGADAEAGGRDADDGEGAVLDGELPSEDAGIAAEPALPESVAENDDARSAPGRVSSLVKPRPITGRTPNTR